MIVLDATIVNVALPSIQDDLGFSQNDLAWVVNAYLIAFGGLLLLSGRIGDLIGQRRIFLIGLAVFIGASLLCALAQSQGLLIGARFVQGVGGALTSAVILGMIVTMFPEPREQAKAIGIYTFVAVAGGSIGLLLVGCSPRRSTGTGSSSSTSRSGWRRRCSRSGSSPTARGSASRAGADLPGAALLTGGLMLGVYTILGVVEEGWGSTQTLGLGAISLALLAAFVIRQDRVATPLMPLRLFRSRNVAGANLVQALLVVGMFGMFFLGALYMQRILGYDALQVGLAYLPLTIVMGTMSFRFTGAAQPALWPSGDAHPRDGLHRRRAAAARAHARRRQLRRRPAAGDDPDRARRGAWLPVADDAGDVGRHPERLRVGLGPRQHQRPGRRRDRSRRAGDAGDRAHRAAARRGRGRGGGAQLRLSPRVPDRRRVGHRRDRRRVQRPALAGARGRGRARRRAGPRPGPGAPDHGPPAAGRRGPGRWLRGDRHRASRSAAGAAPARRRRAPAKEWRATTHRLR